ncbi:hypothetical protein [Streptomyces sp. NPDC056169]|uniref:hypothetical protein n=1 Tax=Streptomyces sp. NPDC056169 TaxID=3345734 RepID=UPI0035D8BE60
MELFTVAYGLDATPAPAVVPRPLMSVQQALAAWEITDSGDRNLVEMLVERLRPR